ncbi:prolactin-7C1 isoform X1 [Mus musculus]|uniref:prolactin-7C1 isoform X1 n=1 Tax=Mus musculus TaxID=10090 RepID=UPI0003D72A82|nr:prolactin-7C1 isoform X1 [Mus musculus]|eukprot:XP_006516796.1 PREDICTED: prolactin-7C1 isoform X1 [Mus musculus]
MLLSLTHPSFSMLPMLLMSNLLQWEGVTSASIHHIEDDYGEAYLKDLFDQAIKLSNDTMALTIEMRMIFFSDGFSSNMFRKIVLDFLKDHKHMIETLNSCHTFSLSVPETLEEARKISLEDFLKIIVSILNSWNKPLYHLETELHCMKGAPDAILIRANAIRTLNRELLETILMILSRVHPGMEENTDYPLWTDLASLQATNKERQFFALYKLFYCLRVDTFTVDHYLKYLMCMLYSDDICTSVKFYEDP